MKFNSPYEAIGSYTSITGALLVATNLGMTTKVLGYLLFVISSIFLLIVFSRTQQKHLLNQQGVFFIINVLGLIQHSH